jgi:microcompartment protein CcmK/EutM
MPYELLRMIIARVMSHVVASAKTPSYRGHKILRLQPETWQGKPAPSASPIIALDLVDAGVGDQVLVCQEGRWARETLGDLNAPVRSMIVAVVETMSAESDTPLVPIP